MNYGKLESYAEQIYYFAIGKTYSRDEADDLSQEILLTALRELPGLRDESRFEPWLWGVANNVAKTFRRKLGKQRAMFSYDGLEDIPYIDNYPVEDEELYSRLRDKIALLSSIYRDCIILHYYDGLSVKEIAARLSVPEGTVTWRLSEARKKLKKEYTSMEEKALRPVTMCVDIYGYGNYNGKDIPFPSVFISDSLSQNILYNCYESPKTVEELAKLCGVPAYYIEERIDNLVRREAVIETAKGKYQTDFIIWTDKYGEYCSENAERTILPIMNRMTDALKSLTHDAMKIDFYKAERAETDMLYIFGVLAFTMLMRESDLPYPEIKTAYDGYEWRYIAGMEEKPHLRKRVGWQIGANLGSRGTYTHRSYHHIADLPSRGMMSSDVINVCEDIITTGDTEYKETAAKAIQSGYIKRKEDGSLIVTCPAFTKEQFEEFCRLYKKHVSPLADEYLTLVKEYIKGYKKLFPSHLADDVDRMCRQTAIDFYSVIVEYALRNGIFAPPASGFTTDVLIQHDLCARRI